MACDRKMPEVRSAMGMPTRTGPLARQAGDRHQPAHALGDLVHTGPGGVGAALPKARDAAIDYARIDLGHRVVVHAQSVFHIGPVVLHDHIRLCGKLHKDRVSLVALQVEGHAALVAMQVLEVESMPAGACGVVAGARRLNFDRVCAPVGELPDRRGTGAVRRQVENRQTFKRKTGHACGSLLLPQDGVPHRLSPVLAKVATPTRDGI